MTLSVLDFIPQNEHEAIRSRTSTYDATANLQSWLTACRDQRVKGVLDAGRYRISGPLFMTELNFETCHIEGEGSGSANVHTKSEIDSTQTDTPALCIQYGRSVRIANIALIGVNLAPESVGNPSIDKDDYITPGIRTSRYSPHAGICVDPAVGPVPPDGGYPGMTYQNNVGGSAYLDFENVSIRGFAVGAMLSPDGTSTQGDDIRFRRCHIDYCDTLIAIGQDQNRAISITESHLGHCRVCFTGFEYGEQSGVPPFVSNCQVIQAYAIFQFDATRGIMRMDNVYAEQIARIGLWGRGVTSERKTLQLSGCEFQFAPTAEGRDAPLLLETYGPTSIQGSFLRDTRSTMRTMNFSGDAPIDFNTVGFLGAWDTETGSFIGNSTDPPLIKFNTCEAQARATGQSLIDDAIVSDQFITIRGIADVVFTETQVSFISISDAGSVIIPGTILLWRIRPQFGSLLASDVPSLICVDVAGSRVTCDLLFDRSVYDETRIAAFVKEQLRV